MYYVHVYNNKKIGGHRAGQVRPRRVRAEEVPTGVRPVLAHRGTCVRPPLSLTLTVLTLPTVGYDLKRVPASLHKLAFLVGRWRSEFGGKADFPTIPRFTYGEQLDFSVASVQDNGTALLNYTSSPLISIGYLLRWSLAGRSLGTTATSPSCTARPASSLSTPTPPGWP